MERGWVLQRGADKVYRVQSLLSLLDPRVNAGYSNTWISSPSFPVCQRPGTFILTCTLHMFVWSITHTYLYVHVLLVRVSLKPMKRNQPMIHVLKLIS